MAMQDIAAPPALEEFDEQRQPQPDVVSFPNFTADPISMNLAHFARSTTRISGVENIALRMTSGMQLSSHLASAHFASPAVDPAVIAWSSPMPILNSYPTQTSSIANETQVQDSYYRPWQTSVTPRCTTGLQRQAAYSNVMGLPGPMGYDIGFGNTHAAGLQYQAGYIDSALRYRSGIGNASANWPGFRQQQMNIYQPMPNPWDLQRPRGFSRVETYNPNRLAMSNEVAGPSNTIISSAPDQRLQNFMFALGMIPTNPSDAVAKRFKLVDSPQNSRTRSGHPFGTQECVKKLVINDISTPGASCSITGDPVMRCQMCDEKIDPAVLKNADRRYCSDCWLYVYFWKTPE